MDFNVLTVSGLNAYIRSMFDDDPNLTYVFLSGEISNFTAHRTSGHLYFSVKDSKSAIKCVMFAGNARLLKFKPDNGMSVLLRGRVSVYEISGQYQFYVEDMQPIGIGALSLAFEQLKQKLSLEGLFDDIHKKQLPMYPQRIGVITSDTGAAIRDIQNVINRRFPLCEIVLCPVLVQGDKAASQITSAVTLFNEKKLADVIIVGRGGGAIEDLWAFNDEGLAREIFKSEIPIVSAVGHEIDYTICDFVADMRAPTPSAAAELVVPDVRDIVMGIDVVLERMHELVKSKITLAYDKVSCLEKIMKKLSPIVDLQNKMLMVDNLSSRLDLVYTSLIEKKYNCFSNLVAKLESLNPLAILSRGYSIIKKDNNIIKSTKCILPGDQVDITLSDGELLCSVLEKR